MGIIFHENDIHRAGSGESERVTIRKKQLVTSLALGVDDFRNRLKLWLIKTKAFWSDQIVVISDGALWIANTVAEQMPLALHVLDWYHTTEALWACAKNTFGEKSKEVRPWVEKFKTLIWNGHIEEALNKILIEAHTAKKSTHLFQLHGYFNSRKKQMAYAEYRKQGIYIGSCQPEGSQPAGGAIESANKYAIQDRLKRAGMKWSIRGANAIAYLRTQYLSQNWDSIWSVAPP